MPPEPGLAMSSLPTNARALLALSLPLALAGCYPTVDVFPLDELAPSTGATAIARPVRLYLEEAPRCAYAPIARVTVTPTEEGQRLWTEHVANEVRARARAIGADAVIGLRQLTEAGEERLVTSGQRERVRDSTRMRATVAETTAVQRARKEWLEGTAVRFREESCRE